MIKKWETLSTQPVNENPWGGYYHNRFRTADGVEGDYYYHANLNAIDVFPMLDDGRFVMLREYRYLFDKVSLSNVQGGIEKGEKPEETARRETEEESGYRPGKMIKVGEFASAPAFSKELCYVYIATNLEKTETKPEDREYTEPVKMTADEIDDAIRSGEIWDSQVMATWNMVKLYLEKNSV